MSDEINPLLENQFSDREMQQAQVNIGVGGSRELYDERNGDMNSSPLDQKSKASSFHTLIHMLKGNIGTGILAMPDAFRNSGLLMGTVSTIIMGAFCTHCMHMLVNSSRLIRQKYQIRDLGYADVAFNAFVTSNGDSTFKSKCFKALVNIFLCITQFGFCCVYFVFVAANLRDVFKQIIPDVSFVWYFWLLLFILGPICVLCDLKHLSQPSLVATCMTFGGLGITMYYVLRSLPSLSSVNYFSSWSQLPIYFGTAIFAFEGIGMVLPLQNNMKRPEMFVGTYGVLNISMVIVTVLYTTVGFFGYLKYGDCTILGSITLNIPQKDFLADCVRLTMAISILLSYPLQFFVPMGVIRPLLVHFIPVTQTRNIIWFEQLATIALVFMTFVLAIIVPNLTDIISFFGAFSSSILALIFPPIIEMATIDLDTLTEDNKKLVIIKDRIIVILGSIGFVFGVYANSINIFSKDRQPINVFNCTEV